MTERLAYGLLEVSTMLGVSEAMVRLEVNRGHLRTYRIGKRILVGAESLKAYLAERSRQSSGTSETTGTQGDRMKQDFKT